MRCGVQQHTQNLSAHLVANSKEHLNNHMILKLMFTDLFLKTGQHRHRGIHRVNTITHMAESVPEASGEVDNVRYAIELVPGVGNVIVHRKK